MARTDIEEKIIKLALEGKSNIEISNILDKELNLVRDVIASLGILNHENYDMNTFQKIQIERNIKQRKIVDKDFLDDVTSLVFAGFTYVEIASMFDGKTENDIKETLECYKEGVYCDKELYKKVIAKNRENIEKNEEKIFKRFEELEKNGMNLKQISTSNLVQRYNKRKRIRAMLLEYINFNMALTDQYLATKYEFSVFTIQRILGGLEEKKVVLEVIDEETLSKIQSTRKERKEASKVELRNTYGYYFQDSLSEEERLQLDKISKQMNLWIPIMITFQLSISDLAILTGFPKEAYLQKSLMKSAENINAYYVNALNYLFANRVATQEKEREERRTKAKEFLKNLSQAQVTKNKERETKLLQWITDAKARQLLNSQKPLEQMKEEEKNIIYEYRIKYALPYYFFPYSKDTLIKYTPLKYQEEMEEISEYNNDTARETFRRSVANQNYLQNNELRPKR